MDAVSDLVGEPTYRHPYARARASNDLLALPGVDGRSSQARRYRDLVLGFLKALGLSAKDDIDDVLRELIRSTATFQLQLDDLNARQLAEPKADLAQAIKALANTINRQRWMLGLGRRKRPDLGHDLKNYIAEVKARKAKTP